MKTQIGARFLARERKNNVTKETVCTQHVKRESKLERLSSGAVRRVK